MLICLNIFTCPLYKKQNQLNLIKFSYHKIYLYCNDLELSIKPPLYRMSLKPTKLGKYTTTLLHSNSQFTVRKTVDISQKLTLRCYPLIKTTLTEDQHKIKCTKLLERCKRYESIEQDSIQSIKECFLHMEANQKSIVMVGEEFSSQSLMDFVGTFDKIDTAALQELFLSLLEGIRQMHSLSIIHAKITPQTIRKRGDKYKLTLQLPVEIDMYQRRQDNTLQQRYTRYTAPEIKNMQAYDGKADVWSLGIVLFELITGLSLQTIYKSNNYIQADSFLMAKLPNNKVRTLIKGMISKDPMHRPSIDEVYQQFTSINLSFHQNYQFEERDYFYQQKETFKIDLFMAQNNKSFKNKQRKDNANKFDNQRIHLQTSSYEANIELNRNTLILYVGSKKFHYLRFYVQHHYDELPPKIKSYFPTAQDFFNQLPTCEIQVTSAGTIEFLFNKQRCDFLKEIQHKQPKPQATQKQQIKTKPKYSKIFQLLHQTTEGGNRQENPTEFSGYQLLKICEQPIKQKPAIDTSIPLPPIIKLYPEALPQKLQTQQTKIYKLIANRCHIEQIYEPLFYLGQDCIQIQRFDKALKHFLKIFEILCASAASESGFAYQKILVSTKIGECCYYLQGDFKSLEYFRYALSLLVKNKEKKFQKQLQSYRRFLFERVLCLCIYTSQKDNFLAWHKKFLEEDPAEVRSIMIKVYRNGYIFCEQLAQVAEYSKLSEVYYVKIIDLIDDNCSAYSPKEIPTLLPTIVEIIELAVSQRQKYIEKALSMLTKFYKLIRHHLKDPTIQKFVSNIKHILQKESCPCDRPECTGHKIKKWAQQTIPELLPSQKKPSTNHYRPI